QVAARPPNSSSLEYPSAAANSTIRPRFEALRLRFFSAVLRSRAALIIASRCWGESAFRSNAIQILHNGKGNGRSMARAEMVVECARQTKQYRARRRMEANINDILPPDIRAGFQSAESRENNASRSRFVD